MSALHSILYYKHQHFNLQVSFPEALDFFAE